MDAWVSDKQEEPNRAGQEQLDDVADVGFTFRFGDPAEIQATMRWIREYRPHPNRADRSKARTHRRDPRSKHHPPRHQLHHNRPHCRLRRRHLLPHDEP